ncbi:hypothetical protein JL720_15723 [Aureococcus anophagefferens]|nr:hypothetical protein JL720_15723 [Aureococcus anophagefferens]
MRWAALALAAVARAVVTQPKPTVTPPAPAVAPRTGKLGEFDFDKLAPYEQLRGEFDRRRSWASWPSASSSRSASASSRRRSSTRDAWEADEAAARRRTGGMLRGDRVAGPRERQGGPDAEPAARPRRRGGLRGAQGAADAGGVPAGVRVHGGRVRPRAPGLLAPGIVADPSAPFRKTDAHWLASLEREPRPSRRFEQVYRALTHGQGVAVKVQRPDALRTVAVDYTCFAVVWALVEKWWAWKRGAAFDNGDIGEVVDTVAAASSASSTTTSRPWIKGDHMERLGRRDGALMTQLAVEACTASLVLTGFVHADPHEGNLMLRTTARSSSSTLV